MGLQYSTLRGTKAVPVAPCFFIHTPYHSEWNILWDTVVYGAQRILDCDCHDLHTCPMGPPPQPDWAEFIGPLLAEEIGFENWEQPPPTGVMQPDVTALPWAGGPGDLTWSPSPEPKPSKAISLEPEP